MRRAAFWIALVVAAALVVVALWLGTLNGTFSGDPFTLLRVIDLVARVERLVPGVLATRKAAGGEIVGIGNRADGFDVDAELGP